MNLDRISGIVLFVIGSIVLATCLSYPIGTFQKPGGGLFPLMASILLMGLSALLVLQSRGVQGGGATGVTPFFRSREAPKRIGLALLCVVGYRYVFPLIGFASSTGLLIFVMSVFLADYGYKRSIIFACITAILSYYLFEVGLKIPMPTPLVKLF